MLDSMLLPGLMGVGDREVCPVIVAGGRVRVKERAQNGLSEQRRKIPLFQHVFKLPASMRKTSIERAALLPGSIAPVVAWHCYLRPFNEGRDGEPGIAGWQGCEGDRKGKGPENLS